MKLRTQLSLILSIIIVTVVGTIGAFFYREIYGLLFEHMQASLVAHASSAAMLIDGDAHARLARSGDMSSPAYRDIREKLRRFMKADPRIAEVYTMVKGDKPMVWKFVVDAAEPRDKNGDGKITDDEMPAALGEEYEVSHLSEMQKAFDGPIADRAISADKWGWWLSGYAPVYDRRGGAVAIVGIDISADTIRAEKARLKRIISFTCFVFLGLGLLVANAYAYALTRPLHAMVAAAREIGRGNYDHRVGGSGAGNELGFLANTMNSMAESIRRSFDKLSTLNRTANILSSTLDLRQALKLSLNLALEVTRSTRGLILLLGGDERGVEFAIGDGVGPLREDGGDWRAGAARFPASVGPDRDAWTRACCAAAGCSQCFPLVVKDTMRGYMFLNPEIRDEEFLNTLMKQIAFAIENARLFHDAITDGLTGLFLKRYFQIQLDAELKRAQRHRRGMSLMMIDIDHFKKINDGFGHPQGDVVLREVARTLKDAVREIDIVARYGGEEMAVILPDTGPEETRLIGERLRGGVAGMTFACEGRTFKVTVSVGIFSGEKGAEITSEAAVKNADAALYLAKARGRNRVEMWGEGVGGGSAA